MAEETSYYYEVAILGRKLSLLIYRSDEKVETGRVVDVPLRGKDARGVVLDAAVCPSYATQALTQTSYFFSDWQIETARFMAGYYRCQVGEALALFHPYSFLPSHPQRLDLAWRSTLTPAQSEAANRLADGGGLLFAPTGSGKTEVYFELFAQTLKEGKSAIFLMPEISLTPQMQKRLQARFGDLAVIWHSRLSKKKREETLQKIREGTARIVAGPRSALFLPLDNIGLIVVDEEHDDSYKAHTRPRYHARDVALYMGKVLGAKVVLGSATPSATSYARQPVTRIASPYIQTQKRYLFESGGCSLTTDMLARIERHVKAGGQAMIFLPTRANYKYLYCEGCGHTLTCPFCSVGMSLHSKKRAVRCHYCGYAERIPSACPQCGQVMRNDRMGTAEVVALLEENLPNVRVQQFDKDIITTANKLQKALERFAKKEVDVLVGTQMLAKGHDYPDVTLALILGLDYLLAMPDYRARERAMSLFVQIAGRAGRSREAEVVVQTNQPDFFRDFLNDYEGFLKEEIADREGLYPPHAFLCRLLFSAKDFQQGETALRRVETALRSLGGLAEVVGAGQAPIERIAGKWRFHILLRSASRANLLKAVSAVEDGRFEVDIDPVDFA